MVAHVLNLMLVTQVHEPTNLPSHISGHFMLHVGMEDDTMILGTARPLTHCHTGLYVNAVIL